MFFVFFTQRLLIKNRTRKFETFELIQRMYCVLDTYNGYAGSHSFEALPLLRDTHDSVVQGTALPSLSTACH